MLLDELEKVAQLNKSVAKGFGEGEKKEGGDHGAPLVVPEAPTTPGAPGGPHARGPAHVAATEQVKQLFSHFADGKPHEAIAKGGHAAGPAGHDAKGHDAKGHDAKGHDAHGDAHEAGHDAAHPGAPDAAHPAVGKDGALAAHGLEDISKGGKDGALAAHGLEDISKGGKHDALAAHGLEDISRPGAIHGVTPDLHPAPIASGPDLAKTPVAPAATPIPSPVVAGASPHADDLMAPEGMAEPEHHDNAAAPAGPDGLMEPAQGGVTPDLHGAKSRKHGQRRGRGRHHNRHHRHGRHHGRHGSHRRGHRDHATGQATGRRVHQPIRMEPELDRAMPDMMGPASSLPPPGVIDEGPRLPPPGVMDMPVSAKFGPPAMGNIPIAPQMGPPAMGNIPIAPQMGPPAMGNIPIAPQMGPPAMGNIPIAPQMGPPAMGNIPIAPQMGPPAPMANIPVAPQLPPGVTPATPNQVDPNLKGGVPSKLAAGAKDKLGDIPIAPQLDPDKKGQVGPKLAKKGTLHKPVLHDMKHPGDVRAHGGPAGGPGGKGAQLGSKLKDISIAPQLGPGGKPDAAPATKDAGKALGQHIANAKGGAKQQADKALPTQGTDPDVANPTAGLGGGGGGGGGGGHAAAGPGGKAGGPAAASKPGGPQKPGEAMSEAQQKMAELQKQGTWKKDKVKSAQIDKAKRVGADGIAKRQAQLDHANSELKEAKAKAKAEQEKAKATAQQHKAEGKVTVESLKAKLEASIVEDKQKINEALTKEQADLETKLKTQKDDLKTESETQKTNLDSELKSKTEAVKAKNDQDKKAFESQITAQQAQLVTQAKAEQTTLNATAKTESERVATESETAASTVTATGEKDANEIIAKGNADAAAARSEAAQKAAAAKAKESTWEKVKGWVGSDEASAATAEGESRASNCISKAQSAAADIRSKAKKSSTDIREDGKKKAFDIKDAAAKASTGIDNKIKENEEKSKKQIEDRTKQLADEQTKSIADLTTTCTTAKKAIDEKVTTGQAKIDQELASAKDKLKAEVDKRLAEVDTKAAATREKLEHGSEKDLANLEKMVDKTCGELDAVAATTQSALHVTVVEAEQKAIAEVLSQLKAIQVEAEKALNAIDAWVTKECAQIEKSAEMLEAQLSQMALQTAGTVDKMGGAEAIKGIKKMADEAINGGGKDKEGKPIPGFKQQAAAANAALDQELEVEKKRVDNLKEGGPDPAFFAAKKAAEDLDKAQDHWFYTDDKSVIATLRNAKTPEEREALRAAYKAKTGKDLDDDLEKNVHGSALKEAKADLSGNKVQMAEAALENAKGGVFTKGDPKKMAEALEGLSDAEKLEVYKKYEEQTGIKLQNMLKGELSEEDRKKVEGKLGAPPPPPPEPTPPPTAAEMQKQEKNASDLRAAMDGWHVNKDKVQEALKGKTPQEMAALKASWAKQYPPPIPSLEDSIEKNLSGSNLIEAKANMSGDPVRAAVAQLQQGQDHVFGPDNKKIQDTLENIKDPAVRKQVAEEYEKQTGMRLTSMIKNEMTGNDKDLANALLDGDDSKANAIKMDEALHGGFLNHASDWMADKTGIDRKAMRTAVGGALAVSAFVPGIGQLVVLGQIASGGTPGGTDFGADKDAVYKTLEGIKDPDDRAKMIAEYKARTGQDLSADLKGRLTSGIGAPDSKAASYDVADCLMKGDTAGAAAAKMQVEGKGFTTDQKSIFAQMEGKSPEERKAIIEAYNKKYGNGDPKALDKMLNDNLSGMDLEKAKLLEKDGKVPPEFAIKYAMDSFKTDGKAITDQLKGKNADEIKKIRDAYNAAYGPDSPAHGKPFDSAVVDETSGRDTFDVKMALKYPEPLKPEQKLAKAKEQYGYDRGAEGEWIPGMHYVSNYVTDSFSDSGKDLDRQHGELQKLQDQLDAGGKLSDKDKAQIDSLTRYQELDRTNYVEAKNSVATGVAAVATIVVGTVVSVLTAGAAAPAVIAAVAALIGGAAGMATKMVLMGQSYGRDDMALDAAMTIVNAATAGLLKTEYLTALAKSSPLLFAAISGAASGFVSGSVGSMMNDPDAHNWKDLLKHAGSAGLKAGASGSIAAVVGHGLGGAMGEGGGYLAKGVKGFISGSVSAIAGEVMTDPDVLAGNWDDVAIKLAQTGAQAGLQGGMDAMAAHHNEPYEEAYKKAKEIQKSGGTVEEQKAAFKETLEEKLTERQEAAKKASETSKEGGTEEENKEGAKKVKEETAKNPPQSVEEGKEVAAKVHEEQAKTAPPKEEAPPAPKAPEPEPIKGDRIISVDEKTTVITTKEGVTTIREEGPGVQVSEGPDGKSKLVTKLDGTVVREYEAAATPAQAAAREKVIAGDTASRQPGTSRDGTFHEIVDGNVVIRHPDGTIETKPVLQASPVEVAMARGMSQAEIDLVAGALRKDAQRETLSTERPEDSLHSDGSKKAHLTVAEMDALIKFHEKQLEDVDTGTRMVKAIPGKDVAKYLGETYTSVGGDVGLGRNTNGLSAAETIHRLGLDYEHTQAAARQDKTVAEGKAGPGHQELQGSYTSTHLDEHGQPVWTVSPEIVRDGLHMIENPATKENVQGLKVPLAPDLYQHAIDTLGEAAAKDRYVLKERGVNGSGVYDPYAGTGATSSNALRDANGNPMPASPNTELNTTGAKSNIQEGATLKVRDANGFPGDTPVAKFEGGKWVLDPNLPPALKEKYEAMLKKPEPAPGAPAGAPPAAPAMDPAHPIVAVDAAHPAAPVDPAHPAVAPAPEGTVHPSGTAPLEGPQVKAPGGHGEELGTRDSAGPDGKSKITRNADGTETRVYDGPPRTPEEAAARAQVVAADAQPRIEPSKTIELKEGRVVSVSADGKVTVIDNPGVEVHNHFMGVASVEDFAKVMGAGPDGKGKPLTHEEMLKRMVEAVRQDADYKAHYETKDGQQTFDKSGKSKGVKGGDAFENVKVMEEAQKRIDELRKEPASPENEAKIKQLSEEAVKKALTASQETPFDGAYSIRDTLIKSYIDPQVPGQPTKPYENYMRMTLEALARDGVLYSEQSQSIKKLNGDGQGHAAFTQEMGEGVLAKVNAERALRGEPPIDVRYLAMVETRFLGEEGSQSAGSAEDWKKQMDGARAAMKRGDVMGMDIAGPELTHMSEGGKQGQQRFEEMARMLQEEGNAAGRKLVLRPHVGEGYMEMPIDPVTGKRLPFDRDANSAHYKTAEDNMKALLKNVDAMTRPGPNGEPPLYDPKNPNPEIRFGHSTHATPEIAAEMKRLGIVAEVNLNSNAISGSLQDNPTSQAGRDEHGRLKSFDDHALLSLCAEGVPVILSTDAQSVMSTSLKEEYQQAKQVLDNFVGDPAKGIEGKGTMPVDKETYFKAHPEIDPATAKPPFELGFKDLPEEKRTALASAYERMMDDATKYKDTVKGRDAQDTRRGGGPEPAGSSIIPVNENTQVVVAKDGTTLVEQINPHKVLSVEAPPKLDEHGNAKPADGSKHEDGKHAEGDEHGKGKHDEEHGKHAEGEEGGEQDNADEHKPPETFIPLEALARAREAAAERVKKKKEEEEEARRERENEGAEGEEEDME